MVTFKEKMVQTREDFQSEKVKNHTTENMIQLNI